MKIIYKLFLLVLLCMPFCANADMFAVHGVHIDVTAENAKLAKDQGIVEAQEKAFYKMLDKLTLSKDMEALPVLSSEDILNLVQDFSVSVEKTSSVRYIANVDVQFNPEAIQNFFQENRIPYVTTAAEKSLIFPIYRTSKKADIILFEDANLWSKALAATTKNSDLVPIVVPIGDVDDMAVVNDKNWKDENTLDISSLLKRYDAKSALVADLTISKEDNVVEVVIRPFQNKQNTLNEITAIEPIDAPTPVVLKRTADRVVSLLEQSWREKNAVRFDDPTQIEVSINIQNLPEWLEIRKQLDKVNLIKQYVVKALRRDKAEIEVFYVGELSAFKTALEKDNLFLSESENGWLLRKLSDVPEEELVEENNPVITETSVSEEPVISEKVENAEEKQPEVIPNPEVKSNIKTFSDELYEQVQPETMDMFEQIKKEN